MPRNGVLIAMVAVALVAAACGGDEDRAPADPVEDPGLDGVVSEVDPREGSSPGVLGAPEAEPREDAVADATPVRLGDRFAWCVRVESLWDDQDQYRAETEAAAAAHRAAVDTHEAATDDLDRAEAHEAVEQALGEYRFAASVYGRVRWRAAGLLFGDESSVRPGDWEDATLQVALERALEAFRANAVADTLAAFDLAHQATEAVVRLNAAASLDADESDQAERSDQVVDTAESDAVPFDASKAWLKATEALQDAVAAAEKAEDAREAAVSASRAAGAAVGDAEDAAAAIYQAAQVDGDWEAMITGVEARIAEARSAAQAAGDFALEAFEAQAAAQAAAEAARAAEQATAAARALAKQSGATEGEQAYWDAPTKAPGARIDAERAARLAALSAGRPTTRFASAAQAVEEAAWYAARVSADIDARAVAAFRQSLMESCR